MKIILIYDNRFDMERISSLLKRYASSEIIIFSLISDTSVSDAITQRIYASGNFSVKVYNSAQAVSDQVKKLRKEICKWSADIGNAKVLSRTVKDWLILPGYGVSTWWFSLLSEKNTLKTDAYFRIAQIHAIEELIAKEEPDLCLLSIVDRKLRKSIIGIANKRNLSVRSVPGRLSIYADNYKLHILYFLDRLGLSGSILRGIFTWLHIILRGCTARKGLPAFRERKTFSNAFLFVSYFPAVYKEAAKDGVFLNKYALALQDKLKAANIPITWLLMPASLDGYDFKDAIKLANDFSKNGENLFILDEFLTLRVAIKGFLLWVRQIGLSFFLSRQLKKTCLAAEPAGYQCHFIVKSLWDLSFCGSVAIQGILYALTFREVFKQIPGVTDCLYYCEMHAWEKALNAAKKDINPQIRTIGYQHASVSKNDFGYFYDKSETVSTGKPSDLPLPDILACNGKYLYDLLSVSGYPNLIETEAVRYLYLDKVLSIKSMPRKGRPLLLVAGPYNKNEARALVAFVSMAFPSADQFDIWFKGHPAMPLEEIFQELGLDNLKKGFSIKYGNISEYLCDAWAVIVSTSTVAMEALGAGCEVIIPVFPEAMLMNPLADFDNYYHNVMTPQELRVVMEKIIGGRYLYDTEEYKYFIKRYWNIDPSLPLWSKLLESMKHVSKSV